MHAISRKSNPVCRIWLMAAGFLTVWIALPAFADSDKNHQPAAAVNKQQPNVQYAVKPSFSMQDMAPGRVLVKLRRSPFAEGKFTSRAAEKLEGAGPRSLAKFLEHRLPADATRALASIRGKISRAFKASGVLVIETPLSVSEAVERLYKSGLVEYAQPDFRREASATPNDPNFGSQWGLNNVGQLVGGFGSGTPDADVDAPEAWDIRTDSSLVLVGVVDTGVDFNHPDLSANMWTNPGEIPGNAIDDDSNGYVDDVHGIDTYFGTGNPIDEHGHGTHVAGIIGAQGNNGIGVTGVAWSAQIMALRFMPYGFGYDSDAIETLEYVLDMKDRLGYTRVVLNNSWGGGGYNQALYDAIAAARDADILFVASSGNDSLNTDKTPMYPAAYDLDNIISVGSADFNDRPSYFSNVGCGSVDLFAPGEAILSTTPGSNYEYYSGTSMASPMVAGAAAVVWSKSAGRPWNSIKEALLNSADTISAYDGLSLTQGRLNIRRALNGTLFSLPAVTSVDPSTAPPGGEVTLAGSGFGSVPGEVTAYGEILEVMSWADNEITVRLPQSALGTGTIRVASADAKRGAGACVRAMLGENLVGRTLFPHGWHVGVQQHRFLWLMGGYRWDDQVTGIVERYDPESGRSVIDSRWTMPIPTSNTSGAVVGGVIYVAGGYDPTPYAALDTLQIFSPRDSTWTIGPSLPAPRMGAAVAGSGGRIFVIGGFSDPDAYYPESTVLIYDPATMTWSEGVSIPEPVGYASAITQPNGSIWLIGGGTTAYFGSETTSVQVYLPESDSWFASSSMSAPRAGLTTVRGAGSLYALHGADMAGGRGDGELRRGGIWKEAVEGPAPLFLPSSRAVGKDIYVVGGYDYYFYSLSDKVFKFTSP